MLIPLADLQRIVSGEVTLVFRRWRRPTVKSGGQLYTSAGVLAIESVDAVDCATLTEEDARVSGYMSRNALLAALDAMPEGTLYRIRVRFAGPDPRVALRETAAMSDAEFDALCTKLAGFDKRSARGPWTRATLDVINRRPATLAATLARELGFDTAWFKTQVRKLKALGLTESLEVGYRLSPRGDEVWRRLRADGGVSSTASSS